MPVSHALTHPTTPDDDLVGLAEVAALHVLFSQVADPRKPRGIRHQVATVLTVTLLAALAGARNFREAGDRAADLPQSLLAAAGTRRDRSSGALTAPSGSTLRRVIEELDGDACDLLACQWLADRARRLAGLTAVQGEGEGESEPWFGVAIDGKTVRNSGAGCIEENVKLFSAMLHGQALVIAQVRVPDGTTEVTRVQALLDPLDLDGAMVTADAAHTQQATAAYLAESKKCDYTLTVKGNQPTLLAQVQAALADAKRANVAACELERGHGRIVTRQIWIAPARGVEFPHAAQVFRIRRDVRDVAGRRISKEIVHGVTSAPALRASPAQIARAVRGHWGIENKIHWVRDVLFHEDHQHTYLGSAAQLMAMLRNLAIGLLRLAGHTEIKRATEHIAADRLRILPLLAASRS